MAKKLGRPKKPASEKRTARTELLLTKAEKAAYEAAAKQAGQTLADWVRTRLREAAGLT